MCFVYFFASIFCGLVGHAGELAIPETCSQVVFVTTPAWTSPTGKLQRWTRPDGDSVWEKIGAPVAVQVGARGLGWGLGLHRLPADNGPRKVEGDRRAPAGIFRLTGAFGTGTQTAGRLPWQRVTPALEVVDDPTSRFYNRIVNRTHVAQPDWRSSERMAMIPDYALGIVVAHNPQNIPGAGSCIFLHLWLGTRNGTAGCTVLRKADLLVLADWLDPARQPVLVQLPREVSRGELNDF